MTTKFETQGAIIFWLQTMPVEEIENDTIREIVRDYRNKKINKHDAFSNLSIMKSHINDWIKTNKEINEQLTRR